MLEVLGTGMQELESGIQELETEETFVGVVPYAANRATILM